MIRVVAAILALLVLPGVARAQGDAADTASIAAVIADELIRPEYLLIVSAEGIGAQVAAALGQAPVPQRPRPFCPWGSGNIGESGLAVSVRVMEMTASEARVHVDRSCRMALLPPGGFMSVVRYSLKKAEGHWRIVGRETLFIT